MLAMKFRKRRRFQTEHLELLYFYRLCISVSVLWSLIEPIILLVVENRYNKLINES